MVCGNIIKLVKAIPVSSSCMLNTTHLQEGEYLQENFCFCHFCLLVLYTHKKGLLPKQKKQYYMNELCLINTLLDHSQGNQGKRKNTALDPTN
jgi:hypothetical protein